MAKLQKRSLILAFSQRIRELRGELSQAELSRLSGVARCLLIRYERCEAWPTLSVGVKLANFFEIDLADLLALKRESDFQIEDLGLRRLCYDIDKRGEPVRALARSVLKAICRETAGRPSTRPAAKEGRAGRPAAKGRGGRRG